MKPKGMHDVPTAQSLRNRSLPSSRAAIVAQLARMEHEKARLERELNVWRDKQQQTEGRLQQVQEHIARLQQALDVSWAEEKRADDQGDTRSWREIPLEY